MQFTSISERRRSHHDSTPTLDINPVLDYLRDLDDASDPWGSAMSVLGALYDIAGQDLVHGAEIVGDLSYERETILEAIGFGIKGPIDDGPYTWPTLIETTHYSWGIRWEWLRHATEVMARMESFTRSLGMAY